jgi:hypothetical protein
VLLGLRGIKTDRVLFFAVTKPVTVFILLSAIVNVCTSMNAVDSEIMLRWPKNVKSPQNAAKQSETISYVHMCANE